MFPEGIVLTLFFFSHPQEILDFISYLWSSPKLYTWVGASHLFLFLICFLFKDSCQKYMIGRKDSNSIGVKGPLAFSSLTVWVLTRGERRTGRPVFGTAVSTLRAGPGGVLAGQGHRMLGVPTGCVPASFLLLPRVHVFPDLPDALV